MAHTDDKKRLQAAADLRRAAVERLPAAAAEPPLPQTLEETRRLLHELQVHQIELEMQNEELHRSRGEMEATLEKYTGLYDFAPIGYVTLDRSGIIISANFTIAGLLGTERSRLFGCRFGLFVASDARSFFTGFLEEVLENKGKNTCEVELVTRGNMPLFVQVEADAFGDGTECRVAFMDISERKRLEKQTVHLSSFPQLNPNPVLETDLAGRIIYHNPASLNILQNLGMDESDMRLFLPANLKELVEEWDKVREETFHCTIEIQEMSFNATIYLSPRLQVARIYLLDITERRWAENQLYLLTETASHLLSSEAPQDIIGMLCMKAMDVLDCHTFFNYLIDGESGRLRLNACAGIPEEDQRRMEWLDSCTAVSECALRNDIRNNPAALDPPQLELARSYGIIASACYPLMTHDRKVLGSLSFLSDKSRFSAENLSFMKALSNQIAIALERTQNVQNLKKAQADLELRVADRTTELAGTVNALLEEIDVRETAEEFLRVEVDERLKVVDALREKEKQLIQQNRLAAMGEMVNNIAHQWRQPLNTLAVAIQQLPLFYDSPRFNREFLLENTGKAMELIQHMSRTIDDFRNFFSIDKEITTFNVRKLIEHAAALVEPGIRNLNITITIEAEGDVLVTGYQNEYAQVLVNILSNARNELVERAVDDGLISIRVFQEGNSSVVTVTDNAGGIDEQIIDKLFDPYFTTRGPDKGSGIGLFMSKTIIEKNMSGSLTVRNSGNGAEFRIEVNSAER